jgi:hypothetical protein
VGRAGHPNPGTALAAQDTEILQEAIALMQTQDLYNERLSRIQCAIALQPTDRTPVVILNDMFSPAHMGVKMSDFCADIALANRTIVASAVELGVDGLQLAVTDPRLLSMIWLSKVEIPGVDLPADSLWQVQENELMKVEDYDVILNKGWNYFYADFLQNRLDNLMTKLAPTFAYIPKGVEYCIANGIVPIRGGHAVQPFEYICGGRSMNAFFKDLYRMPDKVQAVFDVAMTDIMGSVRQQLLAAKPLGAWVGGWRSASEFLSPKLWRRFVWPYMKKLAELVIELGITPIFHLDSNWGRDLEFFKEMPKGKCLMYPDGATNIFKIKEVLGDHMCINGDVPPALLTVGTEDEVYKYSIRLIKEIGPTGFILGQGCDIPSNAKLANVKAMIAAATGK